MVSHLLSLLFSLGLLLPAGAQPTAVQELYVKPTEDTSCPEPCHTLDEYVQNTTQYFASNTVFKFLPGTHDLSLPLSVSGGSNLAMVNIIDSVEINCIDDQTLSFTEISNLTLEDMTLSSCILNLSDLQNVNLLMISMGQTINSFMTVFAENVLGVSSFTRLCINEGDCSSCTCELHIYYSDHFSLPLLASNQLTIKDSEFSTPVQIDILLNQSTYNVSLVVENLINFDGGYSTLSVDIWSVASNNLSLSTSSFTGNITLIDHTSVSGTLVYIDSCVSRMSTWNLDLISTKVKLERSIFLQKPRNVPLFTIAGLRNASVNVENVTFSEVTTLGQLFLIQDTRNMSFVDCSFVNNNGRESGANSTQSSAVITLLNSRNISFTRCRFSDNVGSFIATVYSPYTPSDIHTLSNNSAYTMPFYRQRYTDGLFAVIKLLNSRDISLTGCVFSNNQGTSISAANSQYTMSGSNAFVNNSAYEGGAMAFYGASYVTFTDGLNIVFANNSAFTVGGAVYVNYLPDCKPNTRALCFFQLQGSVTNCDPYIPGFPVNLNLHFSGNNAGNGGSRLFGAALDTCIVNENCDGWKYANPWFQFDAKTSTDLSAITLYPLRTCLCENGRPNCSVVFSNCTHYPGETFHLSAVVVGDRFGTVDGSVYAQILPINGSLASLGPLEHSQGVEHQECTNLSYTIFSSGNTVILVLTANVQVQQHPSADVIADVNEAIIQYNNFGAILSPLDSFPVYVSVSFLPCPLGFMLYGDPPGCICHPRLQRNHISCNLSTQTVQRSGTEWVNASFHDNSPSGVIISKYCPNNYCKPETVNVNLEDPDTQCAFHHSGILCGRCPSGLSLALGSAQCLHCSNAYLALLIPFALAGFVLVVFIKLFNLTVAVGSLNGLIFYANIIQANQAAWIPAQQNILTVFIAWLNLDLGIETCFFDGLDAYWKTWLQFVFPLYIWAIAILIIILSHYFSILTKICGNNSVPTLATLFLISYPRLLRTIISIFQYTILHYPDGTSETLWSYDGNVPYFSPQLIPLFLVAIATVLFLWSPYTGILICAQCLQRSSNYRIGKVLAKLKPFLDAYFGPLKDKHRYWVGLLLLVRGVLFICFAATPESASRVDNLITLVAVLCAMGYLAHVGKVYKKKCLSLLENSFLLNLGILAGGTLYTGKAQSALAYTCVGIAFAQFVGIVVVHCIVRLREMRLVRKLCQLFKPVKPQATNQGSSYEKLENIPSVDRSGVRRMVVSYSEYREPVLKYFECQN